MQVKHSRADLGFSLIELLVYIGLSLVVMTGLYSMLSFNQVAYLSGETKIDVQQNARLAMDEITRQLRMVGYYPENFDTDTANDLTSTNPIQVATNNALAISGDVDGEGASTIVYFCLEGTTVRRRKDSGGGLSSYTCGQGDVLAENISNLKFVYYDSTGAPIPALATSSYQLDGVNSESIPSFVATSQRRAVRRIVVTLTARHDVRRQTPQIYTLTSDVRLRNN